MKALVFTLAILIPVLGFFILRGDPVIYSNNVKSDESALHDVKQFANFIQTQPQLAESRRNPASIQPTKPIGTSISSQVANNATMDMVQTLRQRWTQENFQRDGSWTQEMENLFQTADANPNSVEVLDLLYDQLQRARFDHDEAVRTQVVAWVGHYSQLEKRPERLQFVQEIFQQQIHKSYNPNENGNGENQ